MDDIVEIILGFFLVFSGLILGYGIHEIEFGKKCEKHNCRIVFCNNSQSNWVEMVTLKK